MKKIFLITLLLASFILYGCAGGMVSQNVQREFTYDYAINGKTKIELWKNARNYFAESYGDSRAVFRIMDEQDGTIIGKGLIGWKLIATERCHTEYHVRFAAKDNKARLQFELIEGAPPLSKCFGWPRPSENGYEEIVMQFNATSKELKNALMGAGGGGSKLKDF